MSEWRLCIDCHHGYKQHEPEIGEIDGYGACNVEGCGCEQFYNTVENFF